MPRPALLAVIATVVLTACGGSDEPTADEKAVTSTARTVITDARRSCDLLTPNALTTAYGETDPLAACRQAIRPESLPASADIAVVALDAESASVGYLTSSGVTGAMELVKQGEEWRMDAVAVISPPG